MTPQERAVSIYNNYRQIHLLKDFDGMDEKLAIQCSIIAVNEIIQDTSMYLGNLNPKWHYWNEVKKELEKMKP